MDKVDTIKHKSISSGVNGSKNQEGNASKMNETPDLKTILRE